MNEILVNLSIYYCLRVFGLWLRPDNALKEIRPKD